MTLTTTFLDMTPREKVTKAKIDIWDYIRLESYCTVKETITKMEMKRQPAEWEMIFAKQIFGLISKIYKKLIQVDSKKTPKKPNSPILK